MKSLYTSSIIAVLMGGYATGQCNMLIPMSPGHIQISSSQSINATGIIYWVCEGVTLTINSSPGATYLLEKM